MFCTLHLEIMSYILSRFLNVTQCFILMTPFWLKGICRYTPIYHSFSHMHHSRLCLFPSYITKYTKEYQYKVFCGYIYIYRKFGRHSQCLVLPDSGSAHSLSPSAATLGQSLASTATPSTCSVHIAASPPRIFCSYISSEPSKLL